MPVTCNGNFNTYSDPYVGLKGPDNWWCCTWWGAKALYETARHLYASSPTDIYVNGFMTSQAELPLGQGTVQVATKAEIPTSGTVRLVVTPKGTRKFTLNVRVPGWAVLRAVEVNSQSQEVKLKQDYIQVRRAWQGGDRVDVHFDLPLRVVLDNGQGPTPLAVGKVSIEKAKAAAARSIVIYRGPVILAQFRLQNGCDLIWTYSGGDPYLFETVASVPDEFTLAGKRFRNSGTPDLVEVKQTPQGVRLDWTWKTGPRSDWTVRRSALVRPTIPLEIDYSAEIVPPPGPAAGQIDEVIQTGRFCGTRMPYSVSEPSTYYDKVGYRIPPRLYLDGLAKLPRENHWLTAKEVELDNGFIRYSVYSTFQGLAAIDHRQAYYRAVYGLLGRDKDRFVSRCHLKTSTSGQGVGSVLAR